MVYTEKFDKERFEKILTDTNREHQKVLLAAFLAKEKPPFFFERNPDEVLSEQKAREIPMVKPAPEKPGAKWHEQSLSQFSGTLFQKHKTATIDKNQGDTPENPPENPISNKKE